MLALLLQTRVADCNKNRDGPEMLQTTHLRICSAWQQAAVVRVTGMHEKQLQV
jgi:hypothetical protein